MSINPDENEMIAISNKFAKAMGSFVQTDFQYFGYLRNRQRYYIGSKFVGGSSPSPITPKKIEEKIVKKDKNFTRGKNTDQPNPINVPIFLPEKVKEEDTTGDIPINVVAPEKQGQPDEGGNTIKDFERQKDKEKQEEKELQPTTILPEWNKKTHPTPQDYWLQYGVYPEGSENWKNQPWDWGKFFNDAIPDFGVAGGISLPSLLKFAFADGGYVRSATPALIGEAGPELVIPVAKFGEAIEAMYREGASVLISSSLGFLKKLPNSTARAGVMAEANTLASIFGISAVDSIEGNFGLSGKLQNFSVGSGTGVDIPKALPLAEQQMQGGGGGGGLFNLLRAGKNMLKKTKIGKKIGKGVRRTKTVAKGLLKKAGRKIGVKSVAKIGGKALGKGLLKKIPFIGLGAGLLFAGQRMMAGDFKGAGLEMLSGVAGTVPGIGTAVSVGLDATLAAKDMGMIGDGTPESSTPNPHIAGNGMPIILNPSTMKAWERAVAAAAKDGVNLPMSVTSSYRSAKQQQELIDRAAAGDPNVMTPAPVGLSPHGQGWAVDINFYSKANEWMRENGGKYGFKWQGEKDPVHFDFWNNEPNDKWLQPGNRDWIPNNIAAPEKKSGSEITNPNIKKPNVSEVKNKLIDEPVKQSSKQSGDLSIAQMTVPIPIPTPMPYAVPTEVNKDVDDYVVIDVFGKGSKREVVS
tara:strand:- start:399 stop:2471 length:2073 start_codon:yes stop_codon:yes gene_type:complete